jgi:hypothetical protein
MSTRSDHRHWLENWLSYLFLLIGFATAVAAAVLIVNAATAIPFADHWDFIGDVFKAAPRDWVDFFWRQHNEHRIPVLRLFLLADFHMFAGTGTALFAAIYAIQAVHLALLAYSYRSLGGFSWPLWRSGAGVTAFCLFSPAQHQNLTWAFQVGFVLLFLSASLAFLALCLAVKYDDAKRRLPAWILVAVAALAAVLGAGCIANGLLVWPLLVAAGIACRMGWRRIAVLAFAGVVAWAAYLAGYSTPGYHASPAKTMREPLAVLEFTLLYIGGGIASLHRRTSIVLASIGVVFIAWTYARHVLTRSRALFPIFISSIAVFCLATAFITALGRLNFGLDQALATRYQTAALLFWSAVFVLLFYEAGRVDIPWRTRVVQLLIVGIVLVFATQIPGRYEEAAGWARAVRLTSTAVMMRVNDANVLPLLARNPGTTIAQSEQLRQAGKSVFATDRYRSLGRNLATVYPQVSAAPCMGFLDQADSIKAQTWPGFRLSGWAWNPRDRDFFEEIVIADTAGTIVGYGVSHALRPDVAIAVQGLQGLNNEPIGWTAYAVPEARKRTVHAYVVLSASDAVCRLSGGKALEDTKPAP